MPFDGIAMHAVVSELKNVVCGSRITKIYQPSKNEVIIYFRNHKDESKVIISTDSFNCRIHLTKNTVENPSSPPMFCMLLRKHLTGGRIKKISQYKFERFMEITIENTNEFMQTVEIKLYVEIMGKHSNLILVDSQGNIIDSLKRISSDVNRFRQVLPGGKYIWPPLGNKIDMLACDHNNIMSTIESSVKKSPSQTISKWIVENISGVNGTTAREILYRAGITDSKTISDITHNECSKLIEVISDLGRDIRSSSFRPTVYFNNNDVPMDFWVFPMFHIRYKHIQMQRANCAIDFYYSRKCTIENLEKIKRNIQSEISKHLNKANQSLLHLKESLDKSNEMEKFRLWGELLYANINHIEPGSSQVKLPNLYNPEEEITIPLNKKHTPARDAQIYFNKYKKLHSAKILSESRMQETLNEINYLENVLISIKNSETMEDLIDICQELENQGYIKTSLKPRGNKNSSSPLKFKSSEGFIIHVGKNNRQNDILTMKKAKPGDIWLHTKDIPGSHVIIECNEKSVSEKTLIEAAMLAAYYSKAQNGSNVPVDYTFKKFVRKPPGAKPGFVIYDHQKTLYVTPDKKVIDKLKITS